MSIRLVPAVLLALGMSAQPVLAQWDYGVGGPFRRGTPVQALPTPFSNGGSCVQMCVADATPCDPIAYKLADRRCNVNQSGYFPK